MNLAYWPSGFGDPKRDLDRGWTVPIPWTRKDEKGWDTQLCSFPLEGWSRCEWEKGYPIRISRHSMYVNQLSTKTKLSSGLSKLLFRGFGWIEVDLGGSWPWGDRDTWAPGGHREMIIRASDQLTSCSAVEFCGITYIWYLGRAQQRK